MLIVCPIWHTELITDYSNGMPQNHEDNFTAIEKSFDLKIDQTYHLQADESVKAAAGEYNYLFASEKFKVIRGKMDEIGEVGWHYHSIIEQNKVWRQSDNPDQYIDSMRNAFFSIKKIRKINSMSMGWCYGDNASMELMDEIGIKYNCSPLSGLSNKGYTPQNYGQSIAVTNIYNWIGSKKTPFRSSRADYRKEGKDHDAYNVINIPNATMANRIVLMHENIAWYKDYIDYLLRNSLNNDILFPVYSHSYDIKSSKKFRNVKTFIDYLGEHGNVRFSTITDAMEEKCEINKFSHVNYSKTRQLINDFKCRVLAKCNLI